MPRLETLSEIQRKSMRFFPCLEYDANPWSPLTSQLSQCKVALVTSAGLHRRSDPPFQSGDPSRAINQTGPAVAQRMQAEGYERWVESHGGRTAVGLGGIPQLRRPYERQRRPGPEKRRQRHRPVVATW